MTDLSPELRAAIENAYGVFAHYPRPAHIDVCEQCYPDLPAKFARTPLREVSSHMLRHYLDAIKCIGHGTLNDVRYLLPRLLELVAQGEEITVDENELGVLMPFAWRKDWPAGEVAALDRFFAALFRDDLQRPLSLGDGGLLRAVSGRGLSDFLARVGAAGGDAAFPLLPAIEDMPGREIDLRIAGLAYNLASDALYAWAWKRDAGSDEAFDPDLAVIATDETLGIRGGRDDGGQEGTAWNWLAQEKFQARLEAAALAEADPEWAQILSFGEQIIAALIRNRAEAGMP